MKWLIYSFIILLVSGICLSSCKTSRNIDTQKQVDYFGEFQYLRKVMEELRLGLSKQTKIVNDRLSDLKIENTTVFLSPPDSTGKQHVVKESTTKASKQEQERTDIDEILSVTLQRFSNQLDSLSNKVDAILSQKEKIVELSWWNLYKDKIYIGVIILVITSWLAYGFSKKSFY